MSSFEDLQYEVSDFIQRKPFVSFLILLLLILFLSGMVILFIQSSPEKDKNDYKKSDLILDTKIQIPDCLKIEKDYYPSRISENQWSQAEIKEWFSAPDQKMLNELEKTNDKIINEILGVAP